MKLIKLFIRANVVLIFMVYFNTSVCAQITVILNPLKPIGQTNLINLSLVNNTNYSGPATIVATLRSAKGNVLMVQKAIRKIVANNITIINGSKNVETNFIDYGFKKQYELTNGLPPLNYTLCVNVKGTDNPIISGEACNNYLASDILTLAPIYPGVGDVIFEQRPPLHWMLAGVPPGFFSYNIRLTKVMGDENPNKSIKRNPLYINKSNVNEMHLIYPIDATELEMGAEYAWQVEVSKDREIIMKSDVWVFAVEDTNKFIEIPKNLSYVDIDEIDEGSQLFAVGCFKFKFIEEYNSNELKVRLYSRKKDQQKEIELPDNTFQVDLGVNMYKLDLSDQVYLKHLDEYTLRITEENTGRSYSLNILYVNPDYVK